MAEPPESPDAAEPPGTARDRSAAAVAVASVAGPGPDVDLDLDVLARWPTPVRRAYLARAAELLERAEGATFVLAGADAHRLVDALGEPVADAESQPEVALPDGAPFDTVVSVAGLVHHADLARALRGVRRLLRPGGVLLWAEPVGVPGWRGLVAASAGSRLPAVRGMHVGRDVRLVLRSTGLLPTDLERVAVRTAVWPLRRMEVGRAVDRSLIPTGGTP